ncbi:MAG: isoprenylcysteine carboxylmethyltransferase family protein [Terriglobia bacterium]
MSLKSKLLVRFLLAIIFIAAMLFIPAGSLKFWQGWAFMAVVFIPLSFFFPYLYKHDPQLLERRLAAKEKGGTQKVIQVVGGMIAFPSFLLPGLDYRFGWSRASLRPVPLWLTLLSQGLVFGCFLLVFWVMRVNSFASRTIRVEPGQKAIASGPYRFVRHPMYFALVGIYIAISPALGTYLAVPTFALIIPLIIIRLLNEEKILRQELPGYTEYCQRTRFRLIPLVW